MSWTAIHANLATAAATEATLYEVPTGKKLTVTAFNAVNKNASAASVGWGLTTAAALADGEWLSKDENLSNGSPIRLKPGWVLPAGTRVRVISDNADTDWTLTGILENE